MTTQDISENRAGESEINQDKSVRMQMSRNKDFPSKILSSKKLSNKKLLIKSLPSKKVKQDLLGLPSPVSVLWPNIRSWSTEQQPKIILSYSHQIKKS